MFSGFCILAWRKCETNALNQTVMRQRQRRMLYNPAVVNVLLVTEHTPPYHQTLQFAFVVVMMSVWTNLPSSSRWGVGGGGGGRVLLAGCLTSQQHASVSQGWICSDNFTCCHTEIEVADQTFYLTQSQYTDTGPTSPSADPITPGTWQDSPWSANF